MNDAANHVAYGRVPRAASQRNALLALSRTLARSRDGGVVGELLDCVLEAIGSTRGAVYGLADGELELIAFRGIPSSIRESLDRLPIDADAFIAQRAAKQRIHLVARALAEGGGRLDRALAAGAGWGATAAFPFLLGREVRGVLVVTTASDPRWPTRPGEPAKISPIWGRAEPFDEDTLGFLETASNLAALSWARSEQDAGPTAQADLKTAQLAALGTLAASFAEELSAPLAAAIMRLGEHHQIVNALLTQAPAQARPVARLAEIGGRLTTAVGRARDITARLLAASSSKSERLDLAQVVERAVQGVRPRLRDLHIDLDVSLATDCDIIGRGEELTQLFTNLLLNAADACHEIAAPAPGRPTSPHRVRVGMRAESTRVVVGVGDSGQGVPADLRSRIFDPFFTTRKQRLGLGLTLVRQTVVSHRGHLELSSSPLGGALFSVVLPKAGGTAVPRSGAATPPSPAATPKPRGPGAAGEPGGPPVPSVLWVDDDLLFLETMQHALLPCSVTMATSAGDAELLLSQSPPPALIFCDIGLPDRLGTDLHAAVAVRSPDLAKRFVFVTGGAVTPGLARYLIESGCPTLHKPVDVEMIADVVRGRTARTALKAATTLAAVPAASAGAPAREAPTAPNLPAARGPFPGAPRGGQAAKNEP